MSRFVHTHAGDLVNLDFVVRIAADPRDKDKPTHRRRMILHGCHNEQQVLGLLYEDEASALCSGTVVAAAPGAFAAAFSVWGREDNSNPCPEASDIRCARHQIVAWHIDGLNATPIFAAPPIGDRWLAFPAYDERGRLRWQDVYGETQEPQAYLSHVLARARQDWEIETGKQAPVAQTAPASGAAEVMTPQRPDAVARA